MEDHDRVDVVGVAVAHGGQAPDKVAPGVILLAGGGRGLGDEIQRKTQGLGIKTCH